MRKVFCNSIIWSKLLKKEWLADNCTFDKLKASQKLKELIDVNITDDLSYYYLTAKAIKTEEALGNLLWFRVASRRSILILMRRSSYNHICSYQSIVSCWVFIISERHKKPTRLANKYKIIWFEILLALSENLYMCVNPYTPFLQYVKIYLFPLSDKALLYIRCEYIPMYNICGLLVLV